MISFSDAELQILMRAAVPIRTDHRDQFLRALANELMQRPGCRHRPSGRRSATPLDGPFQPLPVA